MKFLFSLIGLIFLFVLLVKTVVECGKKHASFVQINEHVVDGAVLEPGTAAYINHYAHEVALGGLWQAVRKVGPISIGMILMGLFATLSLAKSILGYETETSDYRPPWHPPS